MNGLIHIYCGDGKGKTTAAVGLAVRACGCGKRVGLMQFLKGGDSGERRILEQLDGVTLFPVPERIKFTFQMSPEELSETAKSCSNRFSEAIELARAGRLDVLIFDEAFGAISCGLLEESAVLDFMRNKPPALELVLTGRGPSAEAVALADYVSEIKKVKHPYDHDIPARRGIEY